MTLSFVDRPSGYNSALPFNSLEISLTLDKKSIICLYQRTSDTEGFAMKANQEEILSWYLYAKEFLTIVKDIMTNDRIGEKKQKGRFTILLSNKFLILSKIIYINKFKE